MNVREIIRYYPASGTEAIFVSQDTDQADITAVAAAWHIWDLSEKGCSFETEEAQRFTVGQSGVLILRRDCYSDEIEDAQIVRIWNTGMAVTFEPSARIREYLGKSKHHYPAEDLEVTFIDGDQFGQRTAKSSFVWDISKKSCSFESEQVEGFKTGQTGKLKIKHGLHTDVITNVTIERIRDGGMIVSFDPTNKITKYIGHQRNTAGMQV
ncbi:MAG: hypothetical protein AMJ65_04635 [Phycisphaerae bacterium SG8_4]|nr:MAG: hypothetical protein AMJ65_04635 [Phycisphaerae bacterium SG8_4]